MDLAAAMQQISDRIQSQMTDTNPVAYPPGTAEPPAVITTYPDTIQLNFSYSGGLVRVPSLPVVVLVGLVSDVDARDAIAAYAAGSGPHTIKRVLESGTYTAFWTISVTECDIGTYQEAANTYLAATFHCDITGPGS